MLEVRGLSASYGQHRALEGASLRVDRGEIVVILGANGAGKSTLLRAVSGICEGQVSGSITLRGTEILGLPAHRIVEEGIALVPEGRGVFGDLTVAENLVLGAYSPRARDEEAGNMDRLLRLFPKLRERRGQVVRTMSGGEQQMVAIGRAMMSNPALLTLDEPSLGLSPLLSKELFQSLRTVRDAGIGILLVEQNAKASLAIADRGYLLENGRIVHEGPAEALRNDPAVKAAYLGGGAGGATARPARPAAQNQGPRPAAQNQGPRPAAQNQGPRPAAQNQDPRPAAQVQTPRPAAPATTAPPRAPAGPSPDEIAAAALSALIAPPPRPAPVAAAAPVARPAPAPLPPASPATAPARGAADALLGGQSVADLVARAAQDSRARLTATPGPAAPAARPRLPASAPPLAPLSPAPNPGAGQDRLSSALREIEDAAARARAWRPDPSRHR